MIDGRKVSVIIPAAGTGNRFGKTPDGKTKPFVELNGRPLITHTLKPFLQCPSVDDILIATRPEFIPFLRDLIATIEAGQKSVSCVEGGESRQTSVARALKHISHNGFVLVHDAVRPFVTVDFIERIVHELPAKQAIVAAIRPRDTIKTGMGDLIDGALDRSGLWQIQTPQGFTVELLRKASEKAVRDKFTGTDESSLVERCRAQVWVMEGSFLNFKITSPDDMVLASAILDKI